MNWVIREHSSKSLEISCKKLFFLIFSSHVVNLGCHSCSLFLYIGYSYEKRSHQYRHKTQPLKKLSLWPCMIIFLLVSISQKMLGCYFSWFMIRQLATPLLIFMIYKDDNHWYSLPMLMNWQHAFSI